MSTIPQAQPTRTRSAAHVRLGPGVEDPVVVLLPSKVPVL
jgi:hypothetical protein